MWYSWTVGTSEQSPTLRQGLRSEMTEPLTGYVSQNYSQVSKRVLHESGILKDLAGNENTYYLVLEMWPVSSPSHSSLFLSQENGTH